MESLLKNVKLLQDGRLEVTTGGSVDVNVNVNREIFAWLFLGGVTILALHKFKVF